MTVQTSTTVATGIGNGVTTVFPVGFKFNQDEDLIVNVVDDAAQTETLLTLYSDYTVSGAGDENGGSITLTAGPLPTGKSVIAKRVIGVLQLTDLRNQGKFFAEVHEDSFDKGVMIDQQQQEQLDRTLSFDLLGRWNAFGRRIINVGSPLLPADAATKSYADQGDEGSKSYADEKVAIERDKRIEAVDLERDQRLAGDAAVLAQFSEFKLSAGYDFIGEYAAGITVTEYNQVIRADGEFWRAAAAQSLPYTTTGLGMPESDSFVSVGDAVLRQELVQGATLPALSQINFQRPQDAAAQAVSSTRKPHNPSIPSLPMEDMGLDGQAVHPSVVRTPNGFGPQKFRYWMAVTPYENTDDQTENPCIYGSHDGGAWQVPNGVVNPLVPSPAGATNHNSDPCLLLYNNELWYYYRETLKTAVPREDNIWLMKSSNGSTWSTPVKCVLPNSTVNLSPAVLHDGEKFVMYVLDNSNLPRRRTSADGITFDEGQPVTFTGPGQSGRWHWHVIINNGRFEMLLNTQSLNGQLIFCTSDISDGLAFVRRTIVVEQFYSFESSAIYHGCLVPQAESRNYEIWYSAQSGSIWTVAHIAATLDGNNLIPVIDNETVANYGSLSAGAGHFNSISTRVPINVPALKSSRTSATGKTYDNRVLLASSGVASGPRAVAIASSNATVTGVQSVVLGGIGNTASGGSSGVMASQNSTAGGSFSGVMASDNSTASGNQSAVIASSGNSQAGATRSAVIASLSCNATAPVGTCAVIASTDAATASGARSVVIASNAGIASGVESAVIAGGGTASGARSAVIAGSSSSTASGGWSAAVAAVSATVSAPRSAVIGGTSNTISGAGSCVIAGSSLTANETSFSLALGYATSGEASTANQKIRLDGQTGTVRATNTTITGLDYAELFPNGTGSEIQPGTILTLRNGEVFPAEVGDKIVGVVSHTYGILGGETFACWQGRYLKDEWGRDVYAETEIEVESEDDPSVLVKQTVMAQVENPEWDPAAEYVSRADRPAEWTPVGLLGQVLVRVAKSVKAGASIAAVAGVGAPCGDRTGLLCIGISAGYSESKGYAIAKCLVNVMV